MKTKSVVVHKVFGGDYMKLFSKLAVVAAAFMMVSVFAGCQNSVDSPDSGTGNKPKPTELEKTAEVYRAYVNNGDSGDWAYPSALTFYDDNTWDLVYDLTDNYYYGKKVTRLTGTYEGDLPEGEQFFVEIKKEFDESTGELQDVQDESISCWFNSSKDSLSFEAFGFYYPKKVEVLVEYISTTYDEDSQIPLKCSVVFYDDMVFSRIAL